MPTGSTIKITKRSVDAAAPRSTRYELWDAELKGFGLRVEPSGSKSFVVRYRADGGGRTAPKRFVGLGKLSEAFTPDQARQRAKSILAAAARGDDPAGKRDQQRAAVTIDAMADRFLAEHVETKRKPATQAQYRHVLSLVRSDIGKRKAEGITRSDVLRLHHRFRDKPFLANRLVAVVGSMYGWAASHGEVPEGFNPAARVEKYREDRRERFLSADEMDRLGAALKLAETTGLPWEPDPDKKTKHAPKVENRRVVYPPEVTAALRLLLLTGARLREILHLRWEHVDLERGLLLLPDSKTGRKTIILNAPALVILAELPKSSAFVFPGEPSRAAVARQMEKPRADLKRPWQAISRAAGLDGVRLHDLRHTHASFGAGAGLGLPILGKLLGHVQASTTARYAHLDNDPLRRASNRIGGAISAALDGRRGDVKRMRRQ